MVIGVRGFIVSQTKMIAKEIIFSPITPVERNLIAEDYWILLTSGFGITGCISPQLQLFLEWLQGGLGCAQDCSLVANIKHIIIAGDSVEASNLVLFFSFF